MPRSTRLADYFELAKPRVTSLILMSTGVGFYLGSSQMSWSLLAHTLLGTALVAGGTGALNQFWEREADARMWRTRGRPLPTGRLEPVKALGFGVLLSVVGVIYLAWQTNWLASLLAAVTLLTYLFLYTPLKSKTPLCTLVGAFPGAAPPLIGWAAASGEITLMAGVLYLILFLWQFPHFLAIATLYREDYARGGIQMLPVVEPGGVSTPRQVLAFSVVLVPMSLVPTWLGAVGVVYLFGALALGIGFLYFAVRAARIQSAMQARRLLQATVIYLPILYALMLLDKIAP
ncbi:MAG: protoheme IX farnesyltransferase [Acidobacteria bacterium]|nr:protoheme IX farnesyltransferase [Acidobacteriota bacterium]